MSRGHFIGLNKHRLMLADEPRMAAYERAIAAQVRPGMRVMDLGTGTGVLAMWAARAGAEVIAVEPHDVIRVARRVAADNGLADRITFVQDTSQGLTLEAPVDLVVTECMGNFFVTDEMQPVLRDLPRHMTSEAVTIPRAIRLHLGAVTLPLWRELSFWTQPVGGLDYSGALGFAMNAAYVVACEPEFLVTDAPVVADFPLVEAPDTLHLTASLEVHRKWTLHALLGWFEADLGEGVVLQTGPGHRTHWGQMAFPIPATAVSPGDRVDLTVELTMDDALRSDFCWSGAVRREGREDVTFSHDTSRRFEA